MIILYGYWTRRGGFRRLAGPGAADYVLADGLLLDSLDPSPAAGYLLLQLLEEPVDAIENDGPLLTIGELARRLGVPVRTMRFWSDAGWCRGLAD